MKVRNRAIGSVCELVAHGAGKYITEFAVESEDGSEIATYSTIEELLEYWETYKPTEPLIKDEKIREVIRTWMLVNGVSELTYINDENSLQDIFRNSISFNRVLDLKDGEHYTIDELCGEEEAPEPIEPTFVDLDERVKGKGKE
jgi:hypothetical protein